MKIWQTSGELGFGTEARQMDLEAVNECGVILFYNQWDLLISELFKLHIEL